MTKDTPLQPHTSEEGYPSNNNNNQSSKPCDTVLVTQFPLKPLGASLIVALADDDGLHPASFCTLGDNPSPTLPTDNQAILGIFPKNLPQPAIKSDLPFFTDRIEEIQQLFYCIRVIFHSQVNFSPAAAASERWTGGLVNEAEFHNTESAWIEAIRHDPVRQEHFRSLATKVVETFIEDDFKGHALIAEVVILGPVLGRDIYRSLLSCFVYKVEQDTLLDVALLQGLIQLVESASPGYLEDDDLVKILAVLRRHLEGTHKTTSEHLYQVVIAITRLIDILVNGMVKDVSRTEDHQSLVMALTELKDIVDPTLQFLVGYALQATQYIPDDESILQVLLRFGGELATMTLGVASVSMLNPVNLLNSLDRLRQAAGRIDDATNSVLDGVKSSEKDCIEAMQSLVEGLRAGAKQEWYLTLLALRTFVRDGRLADFNETVCKAHCRDILLFQLGLCQILGEIAMDTLWDFHTRHHAVNFLGALCRTITDWKRHPEVSQSVFIILTQLSELSDTAVKGHAQVVLQDLTKEGVVVTAAAASPYPLKSRLPLPESSPLLKRVQNIPELDLDLHQLKQHRLEETSKNIYIPPMAKANLQARDDDLFPLMEKVQEFLASEREVMLVLGDSGAGKSTFNLELERTLWNDYKNYGPVPLFINLPFIDNPAQDLIEKHLQHHNFSTDQIREMKLHRRFILICDGYDESQLKINIHTTNQFNQTGQWKVKIVISCRTQYLGQDYRSRFQPQPADRYQRTATNLFQESVVAPFTKEQIKTYVTRYVPLEPRPWLVEDYMRMLTTVPKLVELVSNPFLLTLALEALPVVVERHQDFSVVRFTRVQLYDTFVVHWLDINKRRLESNSLLNDDRAVFDCLLDAGFTSMGIDYSTRLASAIFNRQEGNPIVQYTQLRDKNTWKAEFFGSDPEVRLLQEASPLTRSGSRFQFLHRSILEYFFSRTIYDPARKDDYFQMSGEATSSATQLLDTNSTLFSRNLLEEPSIIQFLCERVNPDPDFERQLRSVVDRSKVDATAVIAATNAITILVKAGATFHGADLRSVKIPGADLSHGQFDSVRFQGANLRGANLGRAWLRRADFSDSQMEGVQFGEFPYLEMNNAVQSCAYSPDGRLFGATIWGGGLEIYDPSTWTRVHRLDVGWGDIRGVAFSPDSQRIVSGGGEDTVRLLDCTSGESLLVLGGHAKRVNATAFSPSGRQIASASQDRTVRLWHSETGECSFALEGHTWFVNAVMYSSDGQQLVTGGGDETIRLWDPTTGEARGVWNSAAGQVHSLAFSPDERLLASGHQDGSLQLWNFASGEPGPVVRDHLSTVTAIAFSHNNQWIATSSSDQTLRIWDASAFATVSILTGHNRCVSDVAFSPDSLQIASGGSDRKVRLWDPNSSWSSVEVKGRVEPIWWAAYSPDGQAVLTIMYITFREWNALTGAPSSVSFEVPNPFMIGTTGLLSDGSQIVQGSGEGLIHVWDRHTGVERLVWKGHSQRVLSLDISACGRWMVTVAFDKTARLWDMEDAEHACVSLELDRDTDERITRVAFSPDGRRIAVAFWDGTISIFDPHSGELLVSKKMAEDEPAALKFSPRGHQLLFNNFSTLCLWDLHSETPVVKLEGHNDGIRGAAYSPCGQWIVSCSGDHTARLWHRQPGVGEMWSCVFIIRAFTGPGIDVAWNPVVPMEFVTACEDRAVRVWRVLSEMDSSDGDGSVVVRLLWGSDLKSLCAEDLILKDAIGLDSMNRKLL
ncbi:hypothetical protein BGZ97_002782, partial [Linnemannia gamsii]